MKKFLLDLLVCPLCQSGLSLVDTEYKDKEIESGKLVCPCGKEYIVKKGIPRFVPEDNYANSFSFQWRHFSKTQLDSFNKTNISRDRFREITDLKGKDLKGKLVLDAGCGMGRFSEIAARAGATVIGLDISLAIDAAKDNLKDFPNTDFIQADIFNIPLKACSFDFIYSIGVLHNTPDPKKGFLCISRLLSKNGKIAIWLSPKSRFPWLITATRIFRLYSPKINPERLFNIVKFFVPMLVPLVRIPFIGRLIKGKLIPVCDYKGELPLSQEQLLEWSILDTFNILAPKYLYSAVPDEVNSWFVEAGLNNIKVALPGVTCRAEKQ